MHLGGAHGQTHQQRVREHWHGDHFARPLSDNTNEIHPPTHEIKVARILQRGSVNLFDCELCLLVE